MPMEASANTVTTQWAKIGLWAESGIRLAGVVPELSPSSPPCHGHFGHVQQSGALEIRRHTSGKTGPTGLTAL